MKKDFTSIHIVYLTNFSNLSSKKNKVKKTENDCDKHIVLQRKDNSKKYHKKYQ